MSLSGSPANGGPLNGASSLTWLGEASCIILEHSIASAVCSLGETPPGPTPSRIDWKPRPPKGGLPLYRARPLSPERTPPRGFFFDPRQGGVYASCAWFPRPRQLSAPRWPSTAHRTRKPCHDPGGASCCRWITVPDNEAAMYGERMQLPAPGCYRFSAWSRTDQAHASSNEEALSGPLAGLLLLGLRSSAIVCLRPLHGIA